MASLSTIIPNTTDGISLQPSNSSREFPTEIFGSSKRDIIIYSILFVISAAGNVTVFTSLLRNRNRKFRINLLILNLAIADLIVTFIMIPLEVGWRITGSWNAGDFACRLLQAMRAFGPYLSSMVLVCISLDRYFAIVHPLKVNDAHRRSRIMLTFSWMISVACSVPQVC
jgi:gonadotropin-releasing hormone receptor